MTTGVPLWLQLLLAHLLGDYVFQSDQIAGGKHKLRPLLQHAAWHTLLLVGVVLLSGPGDGRLWLAVAAMAVAHTLIDAWTIRMHTRGLRVLAVDQGAHLLLLFAAAAWVRPLEMAALAGNVRGWVGTRGVWEVLAGYLVATGVGAVVVGRLVEPFAKALTRHAEAAAPAPGLRRAGRFIGLLERTLVFAAMMLRAEAMIGFIIATKAILRLPETREPGTRELAEYYLAGSFASLAWAVLVAVVTRWQVQGHP